MMERISIIFWFYDLLGLILVDEIYLMIFRILGQILWAIPVIGISKLQKDSPSLYPRTGINVFYWTNNCNSIIYWLI